MPGLQSQSQSRYSQLGPCVVWHTHSLGARCGQIVKARRGDPPLRPEHRLTLPPPAPDNTDIEIGGGAGGHGNRYTEITALCYVRAHHLLLMGTDGGQLIQLRMDHCLEWCEPAGRRLLGTNARSTVCACVRSLGALITRPPVSMVPSRTARLHMEPSS